MNVREIAALPPIQRRIVAAVARAWARVWRRECERLAAAEEIEEQP